MAAFFFALGLLVMLVLVAVAFYWQGSIHLPGSAVAYGVEDAIKYITPRLTEATSTVIGQKSVRRILEWEMKFIQNQLASASDEVVVVGGAAATKYVIEQTRAEGFDYEPAIISEVLNLQAEYMASIGAIAGPVTEAELDAIEEGQ